MRHVTAALFFLCLLSFSAPEARADEVVLTFDRPPGAFFSLPGFTGYRESGFVILKPQNNDFINSPFQGVYELIARTPGTNLTVARDGGGVFDALSFSFVSIDIPQLILTASNGAVFIPPNNGNLSGTYALPEGFRGIEWFTIGVRRPDLTLGFIPGVGFFPVTAIIDFDNFRLQPAPTATPEPATLLLLGTGLAGVIGAARRRRKKN